jgi:ComF family protein
VLKIVTNLLDLLYPPRVAELLIREATENNVASLSDTNTHEGMLYILPYQHTLAKALVKENKFHDNRHAQKLLATALNTWIARQTKGPIVFIPIPLSKKRLRERGHNQVSSILNLVCDKDKIVVWPALARERDTRPQTELERNERLRNVKGAFAYRAKSVPKANHFVLIDDVVTTGATLKAARAALAPHLPVGSTLTCLALAH